jgi:hypothetical protein
MLATGAGGWLEAAEGLTAESAPGSKQLPGQEARAGAAQETNSLRRPGVPVAKREADQTER